MFDLLTDFFAKFTFLIKFWIFCRIHDILIKHWFSVKSVLFVFLSLEFLTKVGFGTDV